MYICYQQGFPYPNWGQTEACWLMGRQIHIKNQDVVILNASV